MGLVVPLAILVPLFFSIIRFKLLPKEAKAIFAYLVLGAVTNTTATTMAKNGINNLPVLHLYTFFEFLVIVLFYSIVIGAEKSRRWFFLTTILFGIACTVNAVFFQSIYTFNSYTLSLGTLIIMLFAVNYFARVFNSVSEERVTSIPAFWFNAGIFLYFSSSFFLYVFSNFIMQLSNHAFNLVWDIKASFLLAMYFLFTIGFIKCKK